MSARHHPEDGISRHVKPLDVGRSWGAVGTSVATCDANMSSAGFGTPSAPSARPDDVDPMSARRRHLGIQNGQTSRCTFQDYVTGRRLVAIIGGAAYLEDV